MPHSAWARAADASSAPAATDNFKNSLMVFLLFGASLPEASCGPVFPLRLVDPAIRAFGPVPAVFWSVVSAADK
jgi:hypothetical protein